MNKTITLDAMRPEFRLGSLYDRRTDKLLPSYTLWKEDSYKKEGFVYEGPATSQEWFIDAENTFSSKVGHLEIEAELSLSLLGGLVDIKGHAKYLKDTSSSSSVAKVSLTYKETTVYRELTSDALHNLDYKNILTKSQINDEFTHVVTGIQYGGMCSMVFERMIKENETKKEIEGALAAVLQSIPISAKATLKVNSEEKEKIDNITCTVYSDFKLDKCVSSWQEALSLYQSLPQKISGKTGAEKGVPVKIWLLPKNMLGMHDTLVKELSTTVANKPREIIESLTLAINESCDLLNKTKEFPILNNKIGHFAKLVENYTTTFKKDVLSVLLVSVRSGTAEEEQLLDAVEKHEHSVFGYLNIWIRKIKEEVDTLLAIQSQLSGEYVFFANKAFEQNIGRKITNVVFTMEVSKREDKFTDEMKYYYNNLIRNKTTASEEKILDILKESKWYEDTSLKEKMHEMAYQIRTFASVNKLNENISFFVRQTECEKTPTCCIEVWEKGKRLALEFFEPPTEVTNLRIKEYSHDTMKIEWNAPEEGRSNISNYKIEVNVVTVAGKKKRLQLVDQIKIPSIADETMTHVVTNLQPGQIIQVSVQSICLNDRAFSDSVTLRQMTRLSNAPIEFKGEVRRKKYIHLTWQNPTIRAKTANLKSFLIEYKATNRKQFLKKFLSSDIKSYSFDDLSYGTEYQFRIMACYDDNKKTLPSEDVNLKTEPMEVPEIKKVYIYFCLYQFQNI